LPRFGISFSSLTRNERFQAELLCKTAFFLITILFSTAQVCAAWAQGTLRSLLSEH
jgi:hypothetical protein